MKENKAIVIDYETVPFTAKAKNVLHKLPYFLRSYLASILPIMTWIHKYNLSVSSIREN